MKHFYALLPLLLLAIGVEAQPDRNQRFAAAAYLGGNLSQIHGDSYFGYNNAGLRFGIETHYLLKPQYFISIGIGYSGEGAIPDSKEIELKGGNAAALKLNMIEIPVIFNWRLGDKKATGKKNNYGLYRSTSFQVGAKLVRLIGARTVNRGFFGQLLVDPEFDEANIEFQDFDFSFVTGFTFQIGLKGAVYVQHSLSIRGLYRQKEVTLAQESGYEVDQLRPYSLTFGGKFVFY